MHPFQDFGEIPRGKAAKFVGDTKFRGYLVIIKHVMY
jgi:hypothetical protein